MNTMARLTEQQKDARERILTMALLSGLTASDLVSIGGRLKRQQERAALITLSEMLHQIPHEVTSSGYQATHNGKTIIATKVKSANKKETWNHRERYEVKVLGPKGGVKHSVVMTLTDYHVNYNWPVKLMVGRSRTLTAFLKSIHTGDIPT